MLAMIRKEFAQLRRDRRTAAMLIFIPVVLLTVFGYAARFEVDTVRTAIVAEVDPGGIAPPAALADLLDIRESAVGGRDEAVDLLRREDIDLVVLVEDGPPTLLVDGTQLFAAQALSRTVGPAASDGAPGGMALEILFNPDLDTPTIMIPALIGLILLFIGSIATSLGVVRERQAGTLEQLAVMPLSPTDLFVGKLVPYLAIAVFDLGLILIAGAVLFGLSFAGPVWVFAVGATAFLFTALAIGVLISTVSENQGQAVQLSMMMLLPQVMLSGLIFPVEAMATPLTVIARVLPLTWFNQLARGVMVRGAGLAEVALPLGVLIGMAIVVFAAAVRRFSRELAPSAGGAS